MVVTGSCSLLLALTGFHRIVMSVNITMAILLMTLGPTVANCYSGEGLAMLTVAPYRHTKTIAMWYLALKLTGINTFCRPGIRHLAEVITRCSDAERILPVRHGQLAIHLNRFQILKNRSKP